MNISKVNSFNVAPHMANHISKQTNPTFGHRKYENDDDFLCSNYTSHKELAKTELEHTKKLVEENLRYTPPLYGIHKFDLPNGITREDCRGFSGGESKYYKKGQNLPYIICDYNARLRVQNLCVKNDRDFISDYDEID